MVKELFRWVDGVLPSHSGCMLCVYCSPLAFCAFNLHCLEGSIEVFVFRCGHCYGSIASFVYLQDGTYFTMLHFSL